MKKKIQQLFSDLDVTRQIDEHPKLARWAIAYARAGEVAGEDMESNGDDLEIGLPFPATIRLICDIWQYCEWSEWLSWQRYGGPRGRGPWLVAEFNGPSRWLGATMFLRDPWQFDFSALLTASDQRSTEFEVHTPRRTPLSATKTKWLARAVLDGVRYENDESEFGMICRQRPRELEVAIYDSSILDDALAGISGRRPKKDADGIYWHPHSDRRTHSRPSRSPSGRRRNR